MKMKKIFTVVLAAVLMLSACAHGGGDSDSESGSTRINNTRARVKYAEVLENMLNNGVLPDGTEVNTNLGSVSDNRFAIADVDNDLKDELIILYDTTYVSQKKGYVLAYDSLTDSVYTELENFPSFVFYNRGLIKVEWSHNQGYGEVHPYTLFDYDKENDTYYPIAVADSWNSSIRASGYPAASDTDNAGTVYYVYVISDAKTNYAYEVPTVAATDATDAEQAAAAYVQPAEDSSEAVPEASPEELASSAQAENGNARARYYTETLQGYSGVNAEAIDLYSTENIIPKSAYEKWYRRVGQNTGKITINYKFVTEENISALR